MPLSRMKPRSRVMAAARPRNRVKIFAPPLLPAQNGIHQFGNASCRAIEVLPKFGEGLQDRQIVLDLMFLAVTVLTLLFKSGR